MKHQIRGFLRVHRALAGALLLCAPTVAQTIVVDRASQDVVDFGGAQTVADLPGPDGRVTIREAITAANNTSGSQTIAFAIPRADWSPFSGEVAIIEIEDMLLVSDDETILDFTTQAAFTGDTNPDGNEVGFQYVGAPAGVPCLYIAADRCAVRGLDVTLGNNVGNSVWITGNENVVVGCNTSALEIRGFGTGGAWNRIGGTEPGEGNTFAGNVRVISGASDNVLVGNTFRGGLRIAGDTFYGTCDRNRVGGPTAQERNVLAGGGYYGEEGFPIGTQLSVSYARDTRIEGNYVGTTADGLAKHPGHSGTLGIGVDLGAVGTLVKDNVVSGILMVGTNHYQGQRFGVGIEVKGSARDTVIEGNRVGLAAMGATPIPNRAGLVVQSNPNGTPTEVLVGGAASGASNEIAYNEKSGVQVANQANSVRIQRNSIHDNGALGIDLTGFSGLGVTLNDPLDADEEGGNHLQNFPVLTRAYVRGNSLVVRGTLDSEPGRSFELDFYAVSAADPSGFGEGAVFLGSALATTNGSGHANFAALLGADVPTDWAVTATATHVDRGETSEFSRAIASRRLHLVR